MRASAVGDAAPGVPPDRRELPKPGPHRTRRRFPRLLALIGIVRYSPVVYSRSVLVRIIFIILLRILVIRRPLHVLIILIILDLTSILLLRGRIFSRGVSTIPRSYNSQDYNSCHNN